MTLDNFIKGLSILRPFYTNPDGYHLGADHDIIYIYPTERPVGADDVATLMGLGFFQPEVDTGDETAMVADYDPTEGWAVFV